MEAIKEIDPMLRSVQSTGRLPTPLAPVFRSNLATKVVFNPSGVGSKRLVKSKHNRQVSIVLTALAMAMFGAIEVFRLLESIEPSTTPSIEPIATTQIPVSEIEQPKTPSAQPIDIPQIPVSEIEPLKTPSAQPLAMPPLAVPEFEPLRTPIVTPFPVSKIEPSKTPNAKPIATTQIPVSNKGLSSANEYRKSATKKRIAGDYQGALVDYDRAIQINPDNADVYRDRGDLKLSMLNDLQGARVDYDRARQIEKLKEIDNDSQ